MFKLGHFCSVTCCLFLLVVQLSKCERRNDGEILRRKLQDIDAKLDILNRQYFSQVEAKLASLSLKIDSIEVDVKKLKNRSDGLILRSIESHLQSVESTLSHFDRKLDLNLHALGGKQITIKNTNQKSADIHSVPIPDRTVKNVDEQLEILISEQHKVKFAVEFYGQLVSSKLNATGSFCPARTTPQRPENLISPLLPSGEVKTTILELLQEVSAVIDDDAEENSEPQRKSRNPILAPYRMSAPMDVQQKLKDPKFNTPTTNLLKQLWRRFTKPAVHVNKTLKNLEELGMKSIHMCEKTSGQINQLESLLLETQDQLRDTGSRRVCGEEVLSCCHSVLRGVEKTASKLDFFFQELEKNSAYGISLIEKVLEKESVVTRPGKAATAAPDATVDTAPEVPTFSDCAELLSTGHSFSGVYAIHVDGKKLDVFCDFDSYEGGWTVVQRRGKFSNHKKENFNRNWNDYKNGFGNPDREFWLGNDNIHWVTTLKNTTLLVQLEDFDGNKAFAVYDTFRVDSESQLYQLHIAGYNGNASDSFAVHDQKLFSTFDQIHDEVEPCCSCALTFEGGWWFYACFEAHLNGPYMDSPLDNGYFRGIIWEHWKGDYSLKTSEMKIRPRNFQSHRQSEKDSSIEIEEFQPEDP